jgi:pyruvate formate lyase activating enzyme
MLDKQHTPASILTRARRIALDCGIRYAYTGNVHDPAGQSSFCHHCGGLLIERDRYALGAWNLTAKGDCAACGAPLPGIFEARPGAWGPRRQPVRLAAVSA